VLEQLEREGLLERMGVEGVRGEWWGRPEDLERAARLEPGSRTVALSPFDNLICDRARAAELFGFDHRLEIYVPGPKRRWGYYVLPILYGDRFIGRIEPRLDRKAKALRILGIWFEPDAAPMDDPRFIPALREALDAYRSFVGATKVVWPRTRPGRDIAGALRRLG
jgi:uncharacterized protein YcaQ